LLNMV